MSKEEGNVGISLISIQGHITMHPAMQAWDGVCGCCSTVRERTAERPGTPCWGTNAIGPHSPAGLALLKQGRYLTLKPKHIGSKITKRQREVTFRAEFFLPSVRGGQDYASLPQGLSVRGEDPNSAKWLRTPWLLVYVFSSVVSSHNGCRQKHLPQKCGNLLSLPLFLFKQSFHQKF